MEEAKPTRPGLPPREALAVALVVAFCSICYEFLIARALVMLTGQIVVWQSLTIGIYIAALGVGTWLAGRRPLADRLGALLGVELGLSALGGVAIVLIFAMHVLYRVLAYDFFVKIEDPVGMLDPPLLAFAAGAQLVTVAIGLLSGFEIPLLIGLHDDRSDTDGTHRVLGFSYVGTLVGSLVFGLVFLPRLDLVTTSVVVGSVNLAVFVWLVLRMPRWRGRLLAAGVPALALLVLVGVNHRAITHVVLQNFYYNFPTPRPLSELPDVLESYPPVKRIQTPYQHIDVVWDAHMKSRPELGLLDMTLFLNGHYQFSALDERSYHEWVVHLPMALTRHVPRRALVLGAGDGLLARELLRHDAVEHVTLVELDPVMLQLATTDDVMLQLNDGALLDDRVEVVVDDALHYLRNHDERFDAVFVDFPYPYDFELARLYSVEFFRFVAARLAPDGFVVFDYPMLRPRFGEPGRERNTVILSTLAAAGFDLRFPYGDEAETFVLAGLRDRPLDFTVPAWDLELETVTPETMEAVQADSFPHRIDPGMANSIFHPKLFALRDLRF